MIIINKDETILKGSLNDIQCEVFAGLISVCKITEREENKEDTISYIKCIAEMMCEITENYLSSDEITIEQAIESELK